MKVTFASSYLSSTQYAESLTGAYTSLEKGATYTLQINSDDSVVREGEFKKGDTLDKFIFSCKGKRVVFTIFNLRDILGASGVSPLDNLKEGFEYEIAESFVIGSVEDKRGKDGNVVYPLSAYTAYAEYAKKPKLEPEDYKAIRASNLVTLTTPEPRQAMKVIRIKEASILREVGPITE